MLCEWGDKMVNLGVTCYWQFEVQAGPLVDEKKENEKEKEGKDGLKG